MTASDIDERYLRGRLEVLRVRCRALVQARLASDSNPDDRFRGLYVTDDQALAYLAESPSETADGAVANRHDELEVWAEEVERGGRHIRLRWIAHQFDLTPVDVSLLVVAMAPDLDPRLEKVYGYLHDDVTRRRASIGLGLELVGCDPLDADTRNRFSAHRPLVVGGLILVEEQDRPFLSRSLRVPDEVTGYVLGDDSVEARLGSLVMEARPVPDGIDTSTLERGLRAGARLVYVRDRVGAAALSFAVEGAVRADLPPMLLDLNRLDAVEPEAVSGVASAAARRARLSGGSLIAGPFDALSNRGLAFIQPFAEAQVPTVLVGSSGWDPGWSRTVPLLLDAPELPTSTSHDLPFRLTPEQADRARRAAELHSAAEGREVDKAALAIGARAQNAGGLERLALRVGPEARWDDLVLPPTTLAQLWELVARVRFRDAVLTGWGMRRGAARGRGVTALFAGDSGTGKTLSAEVVAAELGLDLYVVDLATVIDKYIGETEKNLDRIFREADGINGVLLFDEADAIFGKRTDVQDAHDRYANIEVAYLLQRMERFDGIAILTTNLRSNVDEAFLRRLDCLVDFPMPDEDMRRLLWTRHLPSSLPGVDAVDVPFLARSFDLPGGNIRNIALAAAFLAVSEGSGVTMSTLIRATGREYRKLGRLCVEAEFGPYYPLLFAPGGEHDRI